MVRMVNLWVVLYVMWAIILHIFANHRHSHDPKDVTVVIDIGMKTLNQHPKKGRYHRLQRLLNIEKK